MCGGKPYDALVPSVACADEGAVLFLVEDVRRCDLRGGGLINLCTLPLAQGVRLL